MTNTPPAQLAKATPHGGAATLTHPGAAPGQPDKAIELSGLSKTYRRGRHDLVAVDEVTLAVPPGQVLGLLGASAAGRAARRQGSGRYRGQPPGRRLGSYAGLPQGGPSPVRLIIEASGTSLDALRSQLLAELPVAT